MISKTLNSEGYRDLTAGTAIARTAEAENIYRPLVFICTHYVTDVIGNSVTAHRYCRFAISQKAIPVAPYLLYPQLLGNTDPDERALGYFFSKVLLSKCREMWVFSDGRMSPVMRSECKYAARRGLRIRNFTTDCQEVTA